MGRRIGVVGAVAAALLAGCALWVPGPPVKGTRVVAAPPSLVLERAQHWLGAHGFEIQKAQRHRGGGSLVASRSPFETSGYARCAWAFRISGGAEPAARVTINADAERIGKTRVTAKADIALVNRVGDRAQCATQGKLEQEILAAVASGR